MMTNTKFDYTDSVNAAKQGEIDAFNFLYKKSLPLFKKHVSLYLKSPQDIEDVLQNVYITIFQKLDTLQNPNTFLSWGVQICKNLSINEIKRQHAKKNDVIHLKDCADDSDDYSKNSNALTWDYIQAPTDVLDYNPDAHIDTMETKRLLDEILNELPSMQRTCILLWQEELKMTEIAEKLDIPVNTVKTNVHRAKQTIKIKVEELERKGTKLYGLAPLPFFVWIMRQYRATYMPQISATESAIGFSKIAPQMSEAIKQVKIPTSNISDANITRKIANHSKGIDNRNSKHYIERDTVSHSKTTSAPTGRTHVVTQVAANGTKIALSKTLVKIVISIVTISIVSITGIFLYNHFKDKDRYEDTGGNSNINIMSDISSMSSEEIAEFLGFDYIGNQLITQDSPIQIPYGLITSYVHDFDNDGQQELLTSSVKNIDDTDIIELAMYEFQDEKWNVLATYSEQIIDFIEITGNEKCYEVYTLNNEIYFLNNRLLYETTNYIDNSGSKRTHANYKLIYSNGAFVKEEFSSDDILSLRQSGKLLCNLNYSYWDSTFNGQAAWDHEYQENYLINIIDYMETSVYQTNEYKFTYPMYFDKYISYKEDSATYMNLSANILTAMAKYLQINDEYDLSVFSVSKHTPARDENTVLYYSDILWEDEECYFTYSNAGDAWAQIADAANIANSIELHNIYWNILMDSHCIRQSFEYIEKEAKFDENGLYEPIITQYVSAVSENWTENDWIKSGISKEDSMNLSKTYTYPIGSGINTLHDMQYTFMDINDDKTNELIFVKDNIIWALYSIVKNEPKLIFTSKERGNYILYEDGVIGYWGSGGAGMTIEEYFTFDGSGLILIEAIVYNAYNNKNSSWMYFVDKSYDLERETYKNYEIISQNEADRIKEKYILYDITGLKSFIE